MINHEEKCLFCKNIYNSVQIFKFKGLNVCKNSYPHLADGEICFNCSFSKKNSKKECENCSFRIEKDKYLFYAKQLTKNCLEDGKDISFCQIINQ